MSLSSIENIKEVMSNDPFSIKSSLIKLIDKHLGTGNTNPDVYEAGFLGYITQAQTLLTSDVLFNNLMAWNESFIHLLTLQSSLQNYATMFDYELSSATPNTGSITVYVPIPSDGYTYSLTLKNGTTCDSNSSYLIKNTYLITASSSNPKVQKKDVTTGIISDVDINIDIRNGNLIMSFEAEVWQVSISTYTKTFKDVRYKEFYDINLSNIPDQFYDIKVGVYVDDDNFTDPRLVKFNKVNSIYTCGSTDKSYVFNYYGDGTGTVRFGNGIFGYQPKENNKTTILIYSTEGASGTAYTGQIKLDLILTDAYTGAKVEITGTNNSKIDNGIDEESIEQARANIIANTSSNQRLVTTGDYSGFSAITGLKNVEYHPMLLRRDTNSNEIDLFALLYDEDGNPVPTSNISYCIETDRSILSKDYVYLMAVKYGENGIELIPNTVKNVDTSEIKTAVYVRSDYDHYNIDYANYDGKIVFIKQDNTIEAIEPDEVLEFICPFNLTIEDKQSNKVGVFEYIPYNLTDIPQLEDAIDYIDIEMYLNNTIFEYLPTESMYTTNIKPTYINVLNTLTISDSIQGELITSFVKFIDEDGNESKAYECNNKSIDIDNNEMVTNCSIPINEILTGELTFQYSVYYSGKYYNTYSKKVSFVKKYEDILISQYIGVPISFLYDPTDSSSKQPEPAIDRVYMSATNMNVNWSSWTDESTGDTIEGYVIDVEINKLESVDINRIQVKFRIGPSLEEYEPINDPDVYKNIRCIYKFRIPYNKNNIMDGSTYYQIILNYLFKENDDSGTFTKFATYIGYAIFRRRFNDLIYCNVENYGTYYKVYRIPVIERVFFESHRAELESNLLYKLAELDGHTIDYRMLTDRLNFKLSKTIGVTENLRFNDAITDIDNSLVYDGWTSDIPVSIHVSILIDKNITRSKQDIINECKQAILAFLTLKANFNASIIRSELDRYLHDTIAEVISVTVISPEKDIIYFYTEDQLPKDKDTMLSYNPEFIWIDADKIKVDIRMTPA